MSAKNLLLSYCDKILTSFLCLQIFQPAYGNFIGGSLFRRFVIQLLDISRLWILPTPAHALRLQSLT